MALSPASQDALDGSGDDQAVAAQPTPPPAPGSAIASTAASLLGHDGRSIVPFLRSNGQSLDSIHQNWCAAFTNGVLAANGVEGVQGPSKNIATSFLNWGQPAQGEPQPGDVLVLPRGRQPGQIGGHVGIATGQVAAGPSGTFYLMQSGNENGRVAYSWEPAQSVVARRAPATGGATVAQAQSDDPLTWFPVAKSGGGDITKASPTANDDDPLTWFPAGKGKAATPTTQETAPPSFTDAYGHTQSVDQYGNVQTPLAAAPTPPSSLEDLRDKLQTGEINVLKRMAGGPDTGPIESYARQAAAVPVHLAFGAAQLPINALIGLKEGPQGAVTINPETGTLNLTPEAMAATQLLTMGGPAGRDMRFSGNNPLQFVPPTSAFDRKAPIPSDTAANLLSPDARVRAAETPSGPTTPTGIAPPPPVPVPAASATGGGAAQPAGAQVTPAYEAIHTPAEEAAYRATAEGKKLLEPQIIGERDLYQYIPGEDANSAEREQTVNAARDLKQLGIRTPDASQAQKAAAESNNTARTIYLENTTKGPVEINNRRTQRQADIEADKATVFAPDNIKGPVDFEPVVAHMEDVLGQPTNRQNSALQAVYRPLLERIKSANIEDPAEAWGLRQDIDRMTSKRAQSEDVNLHHVAHQLDDVSGVIDKQIEDVAPGYDAMLAKYKEHSRAIDEMDVLQKAKDKLRGPGQTLGYNDFQRFMKNVVDSRSTPSFDLNPYKAISEENMQRLWNIRDSLRRTAGALDLARAAGSDTMPNIVDAMKAYAKLGGQGALHLAAGHLFGPGGNIALDVVGRVGRALADERTRARDVRRMGQMLHPSEPLRIPPGQENPLSGAPPP